MRLAAALGLLVAASGCLGIMHEGSPGCSASGRIFFPQHGPDVRDLGRSDPRQSWDTLVLFEKDSENMTTNVSSATGAIVETLYGETGGNRSLRSYRMPGGEGEFTVGARFYTEGEDCSANQSTSTTRSFTSVREGELASVGQGVDVWTAGFWENGTLFYTNIASVHASDVPRAGWYDYGDDRPLKGYVYDRTRTERPAYWAPCTPRESPLQQCGPYGYGTFIEGFNEALKGLSTYTSRVVHIPPEKAYTTPGNENHVLYGDALVFYLVIDNVVDTPCPTVPSGLCDVPGP